MGVIIFIVVMCTIPPYMALSWIIKHKPKTSFLAYGLSVMAWWTVIALIVKYLL